MATPAQQQPPTAPPPQQGLQHPVVDVMAVLIAAGAVGAGIRGTGKAVAAPPAAMALTAVGVAKVTQETLHALAVYSRTRVATRTKELRAFLEQTYPDRSPADLAQAVSEEADRERAFGKKMRDRLEHDLPEALRIADPDTRRDAVLKILAREERYIGMREEAMNDRAIASLERASVKAQSPKGAFWKLSPLVHQHTPDCVLLGEKFWPWSVLDKLHPPTHPGCRCALYTLDEAVERDWMDPEHANVVDYDALARAKKLLAEAKVLTELFTPAEFSDYLAELEEAGAEMDGAMIAFYPDAATAKKLAVADGEPAAQLHCTLKFLGSDHTELGPGLKTKIASALASFAAGEEPLTGRTGQVTTFAGKPGEKLKPVIVSVVMAGLQAFRKRLVAALPDGVMEDNFPDFKPHLTLRYIDKRAEAKDVAPAVPLTFDRVVFVYGGTKQSFPLGSLEEASVLSKPQACKYGPPRHSATKSLVWADGRAYIPVCDDHEARARAKVTSQHDEVTRVVPIMSELEEAQLRFGKGVREGGEFRARTGRVGHPLRGLRRALIRVLIPELPTPPRQRRHVRRTAALDGRLVDVPEHRSFSRRIGGHLFTSPAGSTSVYRDGLPYAEPPGAGRTVGMLDVPRLLRPPVAENLDERDRAAATETIAAALTRRRPEVPPVTVGASGFPTDEALRDAGFLETGYYDSPVGLRFSYAAPDGASQLEVTYSRDGGKVAQVGWSPKPPPTVTALLDRAPRTWDEFTGDLANYARTVAQRHGRHALLGDIAVNPSFTDHTGEHYWDGRVDLAPESRADMLAAAVARARTGGLTDSQKRRVYAATMTGVHEMLHAANPAQQADYDEIGAVLEEALTEELGRLEAVKTLRRQGQHDVVQWATDHPTDPMVVGSYQAYRLALDDLLTDAKVAPEERERVVELLKFAAPADRVPTLTSMVERAQGVGRAEAERRVLDTLRGGRKSRWDGVPLLAPNVDPSPGVQPHEIGGSPVSVGDTVKVNRRRFVAEEWRTTQTAGKVTKISDIDGGFMLDVRYDSGVDYNVLPRQVVSVEGEVSRVSFGTAAPSLTLDNGDVVRPGDVVRYDGRIDGGMSEARVVRVIRDSNPNGPPGNRDWVLEAVTTGQSLSPGQRVLLTDSRSGSQIELGGTENVSSGGGLPLQRPIASLTLERKGRLATHFDMPPGTQPVALANVVAAVHPRPSRLREEVARLSDPLAGRKRAPVGFERPDGRVEVPDGTVVYAAERAGLTHLPVTIDETWRDAATAELTHDLGAFTSHDRAYPDEYTRARVEATREALAIMARGGGQEEILERAVAFGPLHGGSEKNQGWQTGMKNAWLVLDSARGGKMRPASAETTVPPLSQQTLAALKAKAAPGYAGPALPMQNGLYYRLHIKGTPFDVEHATSRNLVSDADLSKMTPEVAVIVGRTARGYSAFWNPHHLDQYLAAMGWDSPAELKGREVVAFHGVPVGEGGDGEPTVVPDSGIVHRMPLSRFRDRLEMTSNGYGRWDEHTWGDGPDGRIADDGYRTLSVDRYDEAAQAAAGKMREPSSWEDLFDEPTEKPFSGGGWQQKVYGSGGPGPSVDGPGPSAEPTPFEPAKMPSRDRALVRDSEGNEFVAQWSDAANLMFLDPVGGVQAKHPTAIEDLPPLMYLGKPAPAAFKPPPPKTDDAHTVTTKKPAGGSNGAMIAEAADGKKWLVKEYRGDEDRVATELLSNAIYRRLGVRVPEAGQLTFGGKAAVGYPLLDGEVKPWKHADAELAKGFMADALLANWDVVGLGQDNVLWDPDGRPFRVDQGGTLQFRAQGESKPFGPVPSEVWSMNSPDGGQAFGRMAITPLSKREGAARIGKVLKPAVIDELVDAAPFRDEKMRAEVRDALKARVAWMADYAKGKVQEPPVPEGAAAALELSGAQTGLHLNPEQHVGVDAFVHGWEPAVNAHLRSGATAKQAAKEVAFLVRELDSLTAKTRAPTDFYGWAVVEPPAGKELSGLELRDRGFMPVMLARPARPSRPEQRVVKVLIPKGTGMLYLRGVPDVDADASAPDVVLGRGRTLRLIVEDGDTVHAVVGGPTSGVSFEPAKKTLF